MKIKEKTDKIQWFLDFINCDFASMDYSDSLKWLSQLFFIVKFGRADFSSNMTQNVYVTLRNYLNILDDDEGSLIDGFTVWMREEKLESCHKKLKDFFLNMMDATKYLGNLIDEKKPVNSFVQLTENKVQIDQRIEVKITEKDSKESFLNKPLEVVGMTSTDEDTLVYYFAQNVQGIPVGAFRQCAEVDCRKWYVHISKKERKFCSQTCATNDANRKKRNLKKYPKLTKR